MLKRISMFVTLLLIVTTTSAQDAAQWTAYIYESNGGTITEIDPQGSTLRELTLPVEIGLSVHGLATSVSPDGATIAYTLANNASGNVTESKINLFDVDSEQVVAAYTLADGADINSFNQASLKLRPRRDGGAFATGYGYFVDNVLLWEIVSLSPNLDAQILTRSNAEALGVEIPDFSYPIVLDYAGNEITFTLIPFEGALPEYPVYIWNMVAESVFQLGNTSLPTMISLSGDQLVLDYDETLPHMLEQPQMGYVEPYNVVLWGDDGETRVIYYDGEHLLLQAQFIEGDQKIALYAASADFQFTRQVLDLDGNVLHTTDMSNGTPAIYGTPDGFLVLDFQPNQNPVIKHVLTSDSSFAEREIWEGDTPRSYTIAVLAK